MPSNEQQKNKSMIDGFFSGRNCFRFQLEAGELDFPVVILGPLHVCFEEHPLKWVPFLKTTFQ
jgi:hypothetical protein